MSPRPLLLGFTVPDEVATELFALDPMPAVQTHRFAWSLARSLRLAFGEVRLLSAAPVQNWPLTPRRIFRGIDFSQDEISGTMVGFVNLTGVKHLTRFMAVAAQTPKLLCLWKPDTVFIHGVHTPWLAYGRLLQWLGLRVVTVLTDPPGIVLPTDGAISRRLKGLDRRIARYFVSRSSAVVALAPGLADAYPEVRRSLIFPGVLGRPWLDRLAAEVESAPAPTQASPLTVLYAGTLSVAYGVDRMLEAARLSPQTRFIVLGKGDQTVRIASEALPNVVYGGFVPPEDLPAHLLAADILINPRPSDADFASNSFPSKLLEYASTGRPVLTTRIASIPEALRPCFHYIDEESPAGIVRAIQALAALPEAERVAHARRSRETVIAECSEEAIARSLAAFLETASPGEVR